MKIVDALKAYFKAAHGIELTGDNIAEVINAASDDVVLIVGLPAVTESDNGKTLKVVNGAWASAAAELPAVTATDNGKILKVVDGVWAAATAG